MRKYHRLTQRDEYGNADIIGMDNKKWRLGLVIFNRIMDALNRLAAYEDTGLSPEEIKKWVMEEDSYWINRAQELDGANDRLREEIRAVEKNVDYWADTAAILQKAIMESLNILPSCTACKNPLKEALERCGGEVPEKMISKEGYFFYEWLILGKNLTEEKFRQLNPSEIEELKAEYGKFKSSSERTEAGQ